MIMKRWIPVLGALAVAAGTGSVDGPVLTSRSELFGPSGGMTAEILVYDESSDCLLIEMEEVQSLSTLGSITRIAVRQDIR